MISIPSGWLTDKFGAKLLLLVSGLTATLGTVIVIMSRTMPVMFLGGVLIGLATGAFFSPKLGARDLHCTQGRSWALAGDFQPG